MGELDDVLEERRKVTLSNGKVLNLRPLFVEHIKLILEASLTEDMDAEFISKVVIVALKESYPEYSEEQLKKFPIDYAHEIFPIILKVNNPPEDRNLAAIQELRQRVIEGRKKKEENAIRPIQPEVQN